MVRTSLSKLNLEIHDHEMPLRPCGALPRRRPRARRRKMHERAQVQMAAQIRPRVPSFRRTASASVRSRSKAAATKSTRPTRQASAPTWRSMPRRSKSSTTQKPARTDVLSAALRAGMATIRVWDPFVRAFHWSLALSFAVAWLSGEGPERSTNSPDMPPARWWSRGSRGGLSGPAMRASRNSCVGRPRSLGISSRSRPDRSGGSSATTRPAGR